MVDFGTIIEKAASQALRRMLRQALSAIDLSDENEQYAGQYGTSGQVRELGMWPVMHHRETGEIFPADWPPVHRIGLVPRRYITKFDKDGDAIATDPAIESGFIDKNGLFGDVGAFYTREETSELVQGMLTREEELVPA